MELIRRAKAHASRTAVVDLEGQHTYQELLDASASIAAGLLKETSDLEEQRVCFLVSPSFNYVAVQWAIWRAGGIAVPMGLVHPVSELEYILEMTGCRQVVYEPAFEEKATALHLKFNIDIHAVEPLKKTTSKPLPEINEQRGAMMLFTSGTTSRPKGVLSTHSNIQHQIQCLVEAWAWTQEDRIINVLPLHHTHGIINVVSCALWSGASCEFIDRFDAAKLWKRFGEGGLTLFMAVPTVYAKLIQHWEEQSEPMQSLLSPTLKQFRLMVSGSAALPVSTLQHWETISGHRLLERYGMTEIGMALSNPYNAERRAGTVGQPLPGVEIQLWNEQNCPVGAGEQGQIVVKGPNVFKEYWNNAKATSDAFHQGWFLTGDMAILEQGYYRILGRSSVDIIKTGGYKVSALEIEEVMRRHTDVQECAVVGIPDEEWGEVIAAAIVPATAASIDTESIKALLKEQLAPYKGVRLFLEIDALPRNALGKVMKPKVKELFS